MQRKSLVLFFLRPALFFKSIAAFFSSIMISSVCFGADISTTNSFETNSLVNEISLTNSVNPSLQTALPADSAFSLNAIIEMPNNILLMWEIEEGYYLYRKSIAITDSNITHQIDTPLELPKGEIISDEFFGDSEVFYNKLLVKLPFDKAQLSSSTIEIQIAYQGCAEIGYCYPMQQKKIALELP